MTQLVDFPTQVRGNIVDLVLTNMPGRVTSVGGCGRLGSSDHEMLMVKIQRKNSKEVVKEVHNWRWANWEEMKKELGKVNWNQEVERSAARSDVENTEKQEPCSSKTHVGTQEENSQDMHAGPPG